MPKNACRHFLGMFPDPRPQCAIGRDVRAWAVRCNGGSNFGIGLRLPCTRQSDDAEPPLFDCPELDRRTDAEVDESHRAAVEKMDKIISGMSALIKMKHKMIANNMPTAKATCPWCREKDALHLSVALSVNNHMRAHCEKCGEGLIE